MKKRITIILTLLLIVSLVACGGKVVPNGKTEILAELLMVEDVSDMHRYAGMVDYVFVGTVTEIIDGVLPNKIKNHEDNYSHYNIHVDENLKGELYENVEAAKMGGYKKDGTMYLVAAELPTGEWIFDTGLPEAGKQYVFLAYAQPDGSLTLSEIFDNRECTDDIIAEYREFIENEIIIERERFISKYDKKTEVI